MRNSVLIFVFSLGTAGVAAPAFAQAPAAPSGQPPGETAPVAPELPPEEATPVEAAPAGAEAPRPVQPEREYNRELPPAAEAEAREEAAKEGRTVLPAATETPPPVDSSWLGFSFGRVFRMNIDGWIKAGYTTITAGRFFGVRLDNDDAARRNPYYGRSDGFGVGDARINLSGSYKDLYFRLGFDGAAVVYQGDEDVQGDFTTALTDAYLRYTFHPAAVLSVGRFKPPWDVEQLLPTREQYFVTRSLESRGVKRQEGFSGDLPGFRPGRQLGVMLASDNVLPLDNFNLGYAVAVTNGNREAAFNDNDLPAIYGRITGGWAFSVFDQDDPRTDGVPSVQDLEGPATYGIREGVFLGFGGFYNELTFGNPPNRQRDRVWGVGGDISVRVAWVVLQGQLLYSETEHFTFQDAPTEAALGGHLQLNFELPWFGLAPGYRFAIYDPRMPALDPTMPLVGPDDDQVVHHTVGLRWKVPNLPLVAWLDYTRSLEQAARAIPNDRVQIAVQVNFE